MSASAARPVIRLRVPGSRHHLFFFRKMVIKPEQFIEAGTIVDVLDRGGAPIGCGFYNPKSEIALRMLGAPEDELIEKRLRAAIACFDATGLRMYAAAARRRLGSLAKRYVSINTAFHEIRT